MSLFRSRSTVSCFVACLLAAGVALGLNSAVAVAANAPTVRTSTSCDQHSGLADWVRDGATPLQVNQFDPAKGNLTAVSVERTISDVTEMGSENVNPVSGATITFRAQSSVSLSVPGIAAPLDLVRDSGMVTYNVSAFDNVIDYQGSSGRTFNQPLQTVTDTTAVASLAAYTGTGKVNATAVADATNSNTISNGNGNAYVRTTDTAKLCVTYTYESSSVGDCVWHDLDKDGVQDGNEPGVPGITVTLRKTSTGQIVQTQTTGANGCYYFVDLSCTEWSVTFSGVPSGWTVSPTNTTTPDKDSNGLVSSTDLTVCGDDPTIDLGIYGPPEDIVGRVNATPRASLSLRKVVVSKRKVSAFKAGAVVQYRITVTNTSSVAATDLSTCDTIPDKMTFVSGKGVTFEDGKACWSTGSLAPGAQKVYTIKLKVDRTATKGLRINNCAVAMAANAASVKGCRKIKVNTAVAGEMANPAVTG